MTVEQNDKVLNVPDAGGKGISVAVSEIEEDDKVILIPDKTGTTVIRTAPIEVGDAVVLLPDKSGKRIAVRADAISEASSSEEVDPCKSLVVVPDPLNPARLLIQWIPGDNNDEVEYDISLDGYLTTPRTGDIYRTWGVSTTEATEPQLRYFDWHFVTIWGKRRGRYSKTCLTAMVRLSSRSLLAFLSMRVTIQEKTTMDWRLLTCECPGNDILYGSPSGSCNTGYYANVSGYTEGPLYNPYPNYWPYPSFPTVSGWECMGFRTWDYHWRFTIGIIFYEREVTFFPYIEWGLSGQTLDLRFDDQIIFKGVVPTTTQYTGHASVDGNAGWGVEYTGGITFSYDPQMITPQISWDVRGDGPIPPSGSYGSGTIVSAYYEGLPSAEVIVWFYDGSVSNYNYGYIAMRVADRDKGVIEIWAYCSGEWDPFTMRWLRRSRVQYLYFGGILLCSNNEWQLGNTYHGYLPASLLML